MQTIESLIETMPQVGTVEWIGVRPAHGQPMQMPQSVEARAGSGLTGDRFKARSTSREVTFIQAEHIDVVSSIMGFAVEPGTLRRNIVVRGLNVAALKGKWFSAGSAVFEFTGLAHPCSLMEEALGPGGYNAMRGHGGITARIVSSGVLRCGDAVRLADRQS
ncbi:MAG: MOSC domain-containing protein [Pseudomonadales bacterium]|nr:MOSC domain-containing protein [Pseudomonadales bacterium]